MSAPRLDVGYWPMLSKKDFEGGLCAILIQEKYTTENIDSRNRRLGVKDCTLAEGRRLFRQHRPIAAVSRVEISQRSKPLT